MSTSLSIEANPIVVMVEDHRDARPELRQVLELKGYRVIDTDNGRDATHQIRRTHTELLVVAIDVPLLYGLVAARQIIKNAQVGELPVVVVTHDDVVDLDQLSELGVFNNEYVTPLSDYQKFQHLLDYLLPVLPTTNNPGLGRDPKPESAGVHAMPVSEASFQHAPTLND